MNSVRLYYLKHQGEEELALISERQVKQWLSELPLQKQQAVSRLIHNSDRMASLLATRLLLTCAQHENIKSFRLHNVQYPDKARPSWVGEKGEIFDFNVSHSDKMVVVATSKMLKVGVDTERIRQLNRLSFKMVLSAEELTKIQHSPKLFFELWSKKEAVVKAANTTGLGRMRDVKLNHNYAILDDRKWYLKKIELADQPANQYATHLASSEPVDEIIIKQIAISELL